MLLVLGTVSCVGAMVVQLATASRLTVIAVVRCTDRACLKTVGGDLWYDLESDHDDDQLLALISVPRLAGVYSTSSMSETFRRLDASFDRTQKRSRVCAT
jgi:NADPH:quinone reductase-like Zn-dependent oxidoreductase